MYNKTFLKIFIMGLITWSNLLYAQKSQKIDSLNFIRLSQDFLYAAKTGDSTSAYVDTLALANEDVLANQLDTEFKRLAFWLNMYNGFTQVILKNNPEQYETRSSFFSDKQIKIAGQELSLDLIEHGILRRSKIKWSMGYLNKMFPSAFEKKFRLDKLDYRIHFALNCGAKSCPPIAFYEPAEVNEQLDVAVKTYLTGESEFDAASHVVRIPALMGWFRKDFGGKKGMIRILKNNKIIPEDSSHAIEIKTYDWSLYLDNYKS